jgi:cell wall-associated NlpC family hydrolase
MNESPVTYVDLLGAPFRKGGRGPDEFDCYGLVKYLIHRATGQVVPDYVTPDGTGATHALMITSREFWRRLPGPKVGSMIFFKIGREVCHVGYMISNGLFIHAWEPSGGVTVERLSQWEKRIDGFYEYIEG